MCEVTEGEQNMKSAFGEDSRVVCGAWPLRDKVSCVVWIKYKLCVNAMALCTIDIWWFVDGAIICTWVPSITPTTPGK